MLFLLLTSLFAQIYATHPLDSVLKVIWDGKMMFSQQVAMFRTMLKEHDSETISPLYCPHEGAKPLCLHAREIVHAWNDKHHYKEHHLVESFFCWIKEYRRVATRCEAIRQTFRGFWTSCYHLVARILKKFSTDP